MVEGSMGAVSFVYEYIRPKPLLTILLDYAASKGGLTGMMKNLASKLAPLNISVNDVAPALIGETGMIPNSDVIPGGASSIPLGRLGTTQEVANVVTMLATTGFMTGQSLLIAGGLKTH
jgi:3-oxoacyl-[acyl-carrier protein] reductase